MEIDHFGIQIKQTFMDLENSISADTDQHTMQIGWALLGNLFLNTTQFTVDSQVSNVGVS